jgi:predicted RNA-binding protein with PIN domain
VATGSLFAGMEELLIVDGHSAIFGIQDLREMHQGPKRHMARMELTRRLRDLGDMSGWKVVLVFDGRQQERGYEGGNQEGILVIYSRARETADAVVERLAARFSEKGDRVRVASNDNMVMLTSTTFGAEGISIDELEAWMDAP